MIIFVKHVIGQILEKATEKLFNSIVKSEIGVNVWNRSKIDLCTPLFSKRLLNINDQNEIIALTCDRFSINIEKLGDYALQKLTYSVKDCRNCICFHLM